MHLAVFRLRSELPLEPIWPISTEPARASTDAIDIQLNLCSRNNLRRVTPPWESKSLVKSSLTSPSLTCEYDRPTVWAPARWNALYTAVPRTPDAPGGDIDPLDQHGSLGRRLPEPVTRTLFIDLDVT